MGLYRYRVRVPGQGTSRWGDWSTTPSALLFAEVRQPSRARVSQNILPMPTGEAIIVDVELPLRPPPLHGLTPEAMRELVDGFTEEYITRPVNEFQ